MTEEVCDVSAVLSYLSEHGCAVSVCCWASNEIVEDGFGSRVACWAGWGFGFPDAVEVLA